MTDVRALICVNSPSAKHRCETVGGDTRQSLKAFIPGNYDQAKKAYDAGEKAYGELKRKIAEAILSTLDQHLFPGIRDHVIFAHVMTPLDTERELGAERGSAYGRRTTPHEALAGIKTSHMAKNLHFACAAFGGPGIATGFNNATLLVRKLTGVRV